MCGEFVVCLRGCLAYGDLGFVGEVGDEVFLEGGTKGGQGVNRVHNVRQKMMRYPSVDVTSGCGPLTICLGGTKGTRRNS